MILIAAEIILFSYIIWKQLTLFQSLKMKILIILEFRDNLVSFLPICDLLRMYPPLRRSRSGNCSWLLLSRLLSRYLVWILLVLSVIL